MNYLQIIGDKKYLQIIIGGNKQYIYYFKMNTDSNHKEIQEKEFLKNHIKQQFLSYLNLELMPSTIAVALSEVLIELGVWIKIYLRQRDN